VATRKREVTERAVEGKEPLEGIDQAEAMLQELVELLEPTLNPPQEGPGRRRVLPALCLWAGVLVGVLRGYPSQTQIWRLLCVHGLWSYGRFDVKDGALRKRLKQGGTEALRRFFEQITQLLAVRLAPYAETLAPFAAAVAAIDLTTLDGVVRKLAILRDVKAGERVLLPGKLAVRFDLRLQQIQKLKHVADPDQNEKVCAREMVEGLPRGSLILIDLGYFAFEFFDWLTNQGQFWISRLREKTSYDIVHVHYTRGTTLDALVWLGTHRADRARHLVRLVQFRHQGKLFRYITNVRDPKLLPLHEIPRLYARRWDIEMLFKLAKRELKLHLLWSGTLDVVLQQVWAVLTISQILQALRKEIAGKAGVDVFDVSMPLMVQMLPQFAVRGVDPIAAFVERGRFGGMIRPSRRNQIQAPRIAPGRLQEPPPDLAMERKPRYAKRKCGSRKN